jgi:fumarate hydratase class II
MALVQILGNDHAIAFAASQGNFQLDVQAGHALTSIELLTDTSRSFCDRCAIGIEPNKKRIREHLGNCVMLVTALNLHIGYEKTAKISKAAYHEDVTLTGVELAGANAGIARQTVRNDLRSVHPECAESGVRW